MTAVEETELKDKASQEPTGFARTPQNFRDVTNETFPQSSIPATGPESQNLRENGPENIASNPSATCSEQPDNEPEIPISSGAPSESPSHAKEILPENVPLPVESEVDLVCESFSVDTDQVWQYEIPMNRRDLIAMTNCSTPEETVSFLATTAKRQKVEVKLSLL